MIRKFEFVAKLNSILHQFVKCKHGISRSKNSNISWSTFDIIVYTKKGHGTGSNANSLMFFETSCIKNILPGKNCVYTYWLPACWFPTNWRRYLTTLLYIHCLQNGPHAVTENCRYPFTIKVLQLENIPRYLKRNILQKFVLICYILKGQFQNKHSVWLRSWPRD